MKSVSKRIVFVIPLCAQILLAQDLSWMRQVATESTDTTAGLAVTPAAIYVGGNTDGTLPGQTNAGSDDFFLRRVNHSGDTVWTRQFGTPLLELGGDVAAFGTRVFLPTRSPPRT